MHIPVCQMQKVWQKRNRMTWSNAHSTASTRLEGLLSSTPREKIQEFPKKQAQSRWVVCQEEKIGEKPTFVLRAAIHGSLLKYEDRWVSTAFFSPVLSLRQNFIGHSNNQKRPARCDDLEKIVLRFLTFYLLVCAEKIFSHHNSPIHSNKDITFK